jgi:hypothetical protein
MNLEKSISQNYRASVGCRLLSCHKFSQREFKILKKRNGCTQMFANGLVTVKTKINTKINSLSDEKLIHHA